MIGNSQAQANKSCLSEDRQQPFFYLDAFHPTTKVVGVPGLYFVRSGISPAYPPLFEVYV
jgi:hypothetical protein